MDINTLLKRDPDLVCYYNYNSVDSIAFLNNTIRKSTIPLLPTPDSTSNIGYISHNINYFVWDKNEVVGRLANQILTFPFGSIVSEDSYLNLVNVDLKESTSKYKPNSVLVARITSGNKDFVNSTGFVVIFTDETDIRKIGVYFDKK